MEVLIDPLVKLELEPLMQFPKRERVQLTAIILLMADAPVGNTLSEFENYLESIAAMDSLDGIAVIFHIFLRIPFLCKN
jgi:hypothetical protein